MRFVLLLMSLTVFVFGLTVGFQQSAASQIYGAILFLIAAVLLVGAAICSEIVGLRNGNAGEVAKSQPQHTEAAPETVDPDGSRGVWLVVALLAGGTLLVGFAMAYAKSQGWIS